MLDSWFNRRGSATNAALDRIAAALASRGWRPDTLSHLAVVTGAGAGVLFLLGYDWVGYLAVVVSALLDAVDGRVARRHGQSTPWGGVLDLTYDRIVEASVLIGVAVPRPDLQLPCLVLVATWYVNLCVFLAVGAASERQTDKVIDYPPGLLERGEALLFLTIVLALPSLAASAAYLYALLEVVTAAQRFLYGRRALRA